VAEVIIADGKPAKVTPFDFRRNHLASFPSLAESPENDDFLQGIIDAVYTMFPYVGDFFDWQPEQLWFDKTTACYRFLIAWYIAEVHGDLAAGVMTINGIKRKKVDGVDLTFDIGLMNGKGGVAENPAAWLRSNVWGRKALMMIQMSPKKAVLRNCRFT
jgi:hypothetical protein